MFALIARLRTRPAEARRRIAFIAASLITALIAVIWAVSFFAGGNARLSQKPQETSSPIEDVRQEFGRMADSFTPLMLWLKSFKNGGF